MLQPSPKARTTLMPMPSSPTAQHQRLLGRTLVWLFGGSLLLSTTLVPAHTALLGWTPAFWLVGAPLIVLLALAPGLPRSWLLRSRPRRHIDHGVIWH